MDTRRFNPEFAGKVKIEVIEALFMPQVIIISRDDIGR